jgi:hypothetical protein
MRITALVALLALASFAASASADGGCNQDALATVQHLFDSADVDRDGNVTPSEYEGAGLERFGVSFEEIDGDSDGNMSIKEYLELYQRHHPPVGGTEV